MHGALQTRARRPLIFLAVLFCHCLILVALLRDVWSPTDRRQLADDPLILLVLPRSNASVAGPAHARARDLPKRLAVAREAEPLPTLPAVPTPPTLRTLPTLPEAAPGDVPRDRPPPVVDWQREAELEVQRGSAETDRDYRNFAGLTPERRAWLESHHMEPAPEGVHWAHPRVEIINGLPLIWVNNHCVAVPLMMLLMFCSIGHIEPRGDLFERMREADESRLRSIVP